MLMIITTTITAATTNNTQNSNNMNKRPKDEMIAIVIWSPRKITDNNDNNIDGNSNTRPNAQISCVHKAPKNRQHTKLVVKKIKLHSG